MQLSKQVLAVMTAEKIAPEELHYMVQHAAITSLRGFNRRYFHWLFLVQGGCLQQMQHTEVVEIGSGSTRMLEDHDACGGRGCSSCGWVGQVGRWVTDKTAPAYQPMRLS